MRNIIVTRIDDRLIHGQVVTSWIKAYPVTIILIIAEDLAKNMLMQRIYKSVAPEGINVEIMDNLGALAYLREDSRKFENLMILVKTPEILEFLVQNGIPLTTIILGGMGAKPGRETLIRNVSANEAERECLRSLLGKGIRIVYQMVPADKEVEVQRLLAKE